MKPFTLFVILVRNFRMKSSLILINLLLVLIASAKVSVNYRRAVKTAIIDVARKIFSVESEDIGVHLLVDDKESEIATVLFDVFSEVQKKADYQNGWTFSAQSIQDKPKWRRSGYFYNTPHIFLFDSFGTYLYFLSEPNMKYAPVTTETCLIFIPSQVDFKQIEGFYPLPDDANSQMNPVFLIDDGSEYLKLLTVVYFTAQKCYDSQLIEINRFSKKKLTWTTENFSINKFRNYQGCTLGFGVINDGKGSQYRIMRDGTLHVTGYVIDIVILMSQQFNFTPKINAFITTTHQYFYPHQRVDVQLQTLPLTTQLRFEVVMTTPHQTYEVIFLIPPGELYTSLEKLLLPFDEETWMWLAASFIIGISIIFIVQRQRQSIQDFVFGNNVTTPTLNLFIAWFGLGQMVLPRKNFARFLLTLFILFSLIMR